MSLALLSLVPFALAASADPASGVLAIGVDCKVVLDKPTDVTNTSGPLKLVFFDQTGREGVVPGCVVEVDGTDYGPTSPLVTKATQGSTVVTRIGTSEVQRGTLGALAHDGANVTDTAKKSDKRSLAELTQSAREFAHQHYAGSPTTAKHRIVVLPDGSLYDVLPEVEDGESVEVVLLHPKGARPSIVPEKCGKAGLTRVLGTFKDASAMALQGGPTESIVIEAYSLPSPFRCGDELAFKVEVTHPSFDTASATYTIDIEDLYVVSIGVAYGYDFGQRTDLYLGEAKNEAGELESVVRKLRAPSGTRALVAMSVHLGPYNPRKTLFDADNDHKLGNVALTVGVDPADLTGGFVLGGTLFPMGGVGVLVGASWFQSERSSDYASGDVYVGTGELTTRDVFDAADIGPYVGLQVTGEVLAALNGK